MANQYKRTTKWDTTILDILGRTDHWRWNYIKRNKNSGSKHETSRNTQAGPWRSPGFNKVQAESKETVYWPGLNDQLEKLVLNCQLCLKYSQSKLKLTPDMSLGQEIPTLLWTKIATNIFHFNGDSYLLLVDYTSRYPIICKLTSMTAQHIIVHLKVIFSEYVWLNTIVSDNGPYYMAEAVNKTMQEYKVNYITSSPPLSPIKWTCREVCANSENLILQGHRRRCWSV